MSEHWDNSIGIASYFSTLKKIIVAPTSFFEGILDKESLGRAIIFSLISLTIGGIATMMWAVLFNILVTSTQMFGNIANQQAVIMNGLFGIGINIAAGLMTPVFGIIGCFIGAAIAHLCLIMLGGCQEGYLATVKVYLYSAGTNVFSIIPCLGPFVSGILSIVIVVAGLSSMQKVSKTKALTASLLLPFFCCCCAIVFIASVFIAISSIAGIAGIAPLLQNMPK